ncbi:MAG: hypothetical protein AB1521_00385 [Bacteroidota bacterium]
MKTKILILLFLLLSIGNIEAQQTPEAYLGLLPPVPSNSCDATREQIKAFTVKMDKLINDIGNEIDKRKNELEPVAEAKQKKKGKEILKDLDMSEDDLDQIEKMSTAEKLKLAKKLMAASKDGQTIVSKEEIERKKKNSEFILKYAQSDQNFENCYRGFQQKQEEISENYEADKKRNEKELDEFRKSLGPINYGEGSTEADMTKARQLRNKEIQLGKKLCEDYTNLYGSILEDFKGDIKRNIPDMRKVEELSMADSGFESMDIEALEAVEIFFRNYIYIANYFFVPNEVMPNYK